MRTIVSIACVLLVACVGSVGGSEPREREAGHSPFSAPAAEQRFGGTLFRGHDGGVFAEPDASGPADAGESTVELPDRSATLNEVAETYRHLLETNTYESCGEFVQRVLVAFADPEWGHVGKTSGESQHTPPGFEPRVVDGHTVTGFSHDAIYHRASNRQVDVIVNAAANSDPRPEIWSPASVTWGVIPPEHYRENNPWIPAVPPAD